MVLWTHHGAVDGLGGEKKEKKIIKYVVIIFIKFILLRISYLTPGRVSHA